MRSTLMAAGRWDNCISRISRANCYIVAVIDLCSRHRYLLDVHILLREGYFDMMLVQHIVYALHDI